MSYLWTCLSFSSSFLLCLIIQSHERRHICFFAHFSEYVFLNDNGDEECEQLSNSTSSASGYCLALASFFSSFSLVLLIKALLIKKRVFRIARLFLKQSGRTVEKVVKRDFNIFVAVWILTIRYQIDCPSCFNYWSTNSLNIDLPSFSHSPRLWVRILKLLIFTVT